MNFLVSLLSLFWFVRTIKFVLFWIYLWQLKEYHVGRFIDHFRTQKGKRLLFGPLTTVKLVLLLLLLVNYSIVFAALLLLYLGESLLFVVHIFNRRELKTPIATAKTIFLATVSLMVVAAYLFFSFNANSAFAVPLLIFDILTPLIISAIVLAFQPMFVAARNRTLKKAKEKIAKHQNLRVIAITGSYGKTSTKEFLTTILSQKFTVLATKEHQNSEIGIARCILNNLTQEHEIFVVEMGAYKKGGIKLLCDMVRPQIAVVTGVNEQHLALFGTMENLLSAEGGEELADNLPKNGLLVVNGDNKYCLNLYKRANVNKKIYATTRERISADIWTEDIVVKKNGLSFIVMTREKEVAHVEVEVLGKQQVQNLLAAILVARALGMNLEEISLAANHIRQEQGGMVEKLGVHGITIIDSSYSANPNGVMADLDYLHVFPGKKVMVMRCLIELGKKSAEIHRDIGKKIGEVCDLAIITTKERFEDIKGGAVASGTLAEKIIFCEKPKEILSHITTFCKEGDAVLLEGRVPNELVQSLIKLKGRTRKFNP